MNPKLAKEVAVVFTRLFEEENNMSDFPCLELSELIKNMVNNSNSAIKQTGTQFYRELYKVTKGRCNEIKDISD